MNRMTATLALLAIAVGLWGQEGNDTILPIQTRQARIYEIPCGEECDSTVSIYTPKGSEIRCGIITITNDYSWEEMNIENGKFIPFTKRFLGLC